MRLSIIALIAVLAIGSIVISLGFITNQDNEMEVEYDNNPQPVSQYDKLERYKIELEKINQYNRQVLHDLEEQIKNSDDVHLNQLKEEIKIIKRVIDENKAELEQVIEKLSEMNTNS